MRVVDPAKTAGLVRVVVAPEVVVRESARRRTILAARTRSILTRSIAGTDSEHRRRRRKGHCFRRATECVRRKHEAHIPYPGYRASGSVARLDRLALRPGSGP